ncbi:hypothetical protein SteCoe_20929 [Stentor coeruleus]|uniref:Uncharacterized protein n=1 Tax=Stentor coeruleus TaxID=5963 RepID=A0A1R2BQV3_9CILI|nr:hypothetical protein SteCoe_20929 [Stentor coeruleus]
MINFTIDLPSTDENNISEKDNSIQILEVLLPLISQNAVKQMNSSTLHYLESNFFKCEEMKYLPEEISKKIHKYLICKDCFKVFKNFASCGCGFCNCNEKILKLESTGYSEENYLIYLKNQKLSCCNSPITESDIQFLFPAYEALKKREEIKTKLATLNEEIQKSRMFTCINCNKVRGFEMFAEAGCHHMCMICISKQYYTKRIKTCAICNEIIPLNILGNKKIQCSSCNNCFFILGDRIQETCPNHAYCMGCMFGILTENKRCLICRKSLSSSEKLEYYKFAYVECAGCFKDLCITRAKKSLCCNSYYCEECKAIVYQCEVCKRVVNYI